MTTKLHTQPYRGARDFYPQDMQVQSYIYKVWIDVCKSYGFEEYSFPIIEPFEIFAAKTGQEIVNEQLFWFEDRSQRKLAIRPELTPGTVRMIAQKFNELPKPIKWFMIGNNWRYEKPQTGRGREFYQLEANIFGIEGVLGDFEIFNLIIDIMKRFGATSEQFELRFSDRKLINALLLDALGLETDTATQTRRIMDKFTKMTKTSFQEALTEIGLTGGQSEKVIVFLESKFTDLDKILPENVLAGNAGYQNLKELFVLLEKTELLQFCAFDPTIIRGFDYSDGLVYEVFDKNPANRRSLFGGERFDRLIEIFGNYQLPATGFAMGDWTLTEFLKNWNLLPKTIPSAQYLVTTWPSDDKKYYFASLSLSQKLRERAINVFVWPDASTKLDKQLKYADKQGIPFAVILGEEELSTGKVTVKDLYNQNQRTIPTQELYSSLN